MHEENIYIEYASYPKMVIIKPTNENIVLYFDDLHEINIKFQNNIMQIIYTYGNDTVKIERYRIKKSLTNNELNTIVDRIINHFLSYVKEPTDELKVLSISDYIKDNFSDKLERI